jgi:hypothetical protein
VTENLHEALLRLRYRYVERIIWIDALCIHQEDEREKEQQIQLMAKIYGQASRVVVWLGETADKSDQALRNIRHAAGPGAKESSSYEYNYQEITALLQRPWFRRIWVSKWIPTIHTTTDRTIRYFRKLLLPGIF